MTDPQQQEPTPNADACLSVMGACDVAGAVLASFICLEHPHMDEYEIAALASAELFYAAQDTAQACLMSEVAR